MTTGQKRISFGQILSSGMRWRSMRSEKLVQLIGKTSQTVANYKSSPVLRSDKIEEICYALKHNFFQDMANQLPHDFTVNPEFNAENVSIIAQLQEENKVLRIENNLLMKLKG